jgi:hypothetical protein
MKRKDQEEGANVEALYDSAPPLELGCEPPEIPSSEIASRRFSIRTEPGVDIDPEILQIAEFWLNVTDGDALSALLLACERMTQIVDRESFGFRRG